jgi:hypothetical protein
MKSQNAAGEIVVEPEFAMQVEVSVGERSLRVPSLIPASRRPSLLHAAADSPALPLASPAPSSRNRGSVRYFGLGATGHRGRP